MEKFGFSGEQQYTLLSKLSGGEKRRLHLLSVLFLNPNFLVLDEPTNDLDLQTLRTLEEFLLDYPGCILIVSHDRYFMDRMVDHLFAFEGEGVIRDFPGNYSQYRDAQAKGLLEKNPGQIMNSVEEEPVIIQDFVFEEEPIIIAEPVVEPVEEPVVEHVAEPVIEPVIEPIEEPVVEPVTMPSVSNLNSSLKLLILGDIYVETVANTIRSKLISLGYTNCTVHAKQVFSDYTGATLNITNYSTVLLWTSASQIGSTELYTTLKTFVAQGGNVISSIFLHALYPSGFDFTITPYIFEKQSSDSTGDMTFDLVHPITNGLVSSITNGLHILINNPVSIQSDATSIASFTSSKASYVAVQTVGSSRIVGINAYMTDLSHQNFCALVVNTCLWASGILE
jgi:hypothetical protein